ncbi:type II toxin-antitoxin system HigB family toxin [Halomonas sp. SYSU XM8]
MPALRVRFHRVEYGSSVAIRYAQQIAWVRFVGTHAQYDQIDAETV